MGPPVLLITAFVSLLAERPDFAVAGGFHSRGRHSKVLQIALDAASPLVSQHQVVRLRATLVAVSFNDDGLSRPVLDPIGIGAKNRLGISPDRILVVIKKDVGQV